MRGSSPPGAGGEAGSLPFSETAHFGIREAQALLNVPPGERHLAAVKLHDILVAMRREGRLGALRDLDLEEGPFREMLDDANGIVRSVAVAIAGHTGNPRWVALLMALVRDDIDPFVRTRAVEALGNLGAVEALPLLKEVIETPGHPARHHAVRSLARMGPATEPDLMRLAFEHEDEVTRRVAVDTIARTADSQAWERFIAALHAPRSIAVRRSAVEGLGRSRATRAAAPLVRALLEDPAPEVREAATDALVALGEPRTVGALLECALYDTYAVTRPGSAEAWPSSTDHASATGKVYPVREAAAEALLALGGDQALEDLDAQQDDLTAFPRWTD